MNLHEFQGKQILSSFGVQVQRGILAKTPEEAVECAKKISEQTGSVFWVLKAQIHAGGRGKGGGIKLAKSLEEVKEKASQIIGMNLITPQTLPEGKKVYQILVTEDVYYPFSYKNQEFYFSVMLNRATGKNMILYSLEGGVDIESVAEQRPENIFFEEIDPKIGLQPFQMRKIAFNLKLFGKSFKHMINFIQSLYEAYEKSDSSLFEINPVLKTFDDKIIAVDAKVVLDDNSLFRHKNYQEMRDLSEENFMEVEAREAGLNFVKLDGNIGCMVNGAGLAMATMDMIKLSGGSPANFLDVGGSADAKRVQTAFCIILNDSNVKAILINIFGGIVRCDRVAQGILDTYQIFKNSTIDIPIILRLQGTNSDVAKKMIKESRLSVYSVETLEEAAQKVKEIVKSNLC